jgi:hypothetical protein
MVAAREHLHAVASGERAGAVRGLLRVVSDTPALRKRAQTESMAIRSGGEDATRTRRRDARATGHGEQRAPTPFFRHSYQELF